ncbi:MAG: hypothetical protein JEZ04_11235 [Spirochaetales bacterium]|nr:hypothetical protein [Spirochaetales bacterium]
MSSNSQILKQVITDTENIFSRIAEHYPNLLKELEKNIKDASSSLDKLSMVNPGGVMKGAGIPVGSYLGERKEESKKSLLELNAFQKQNEVIIKKLTSSITDYQDSQAYIEEIRDISESLQIVSLNALVNAVKAGKGGEGFSVITENLKNVTGTTIEKTSILEQKGEVIKRKLDVFCTSEKAISLNRKELLELLEQKMMSGIDTFQVESETVNNLLSGLNKESEKVRGNILRVMEELQQQDIIRQTIDQILMSMKELPVEVEGFSIDDFSEDEEMDKTVFYERLIDISIIMIDEVVEKLNRTVNIFSENFNQARQRLEYIQGEKNAAIEHFITNLKSMTSLSEMNIEVRERSNELSEKRRGLISLISGILKHVHGISEEIESFKKISGWLQNVAVLSRIELTRSLSLRQMTESVDDMADLVERIQEQIKRGERETGDFISSTGMLFEEYEAYAEEEQHYMRDFFESFIDGISEMSSINNSFSDVLKDFNFFSEKFRNLFEISSGEMEQLKKLTGELSHVSGNLQTLKVRFDETIKKKIGEKEIQEWNISDESLNKIIERFTIYSHKRSAGEVTGLNVEESALGAGEVTLF